MRFLADGPSIPDELLEARDRGEVVFLCGAGVSYPACMPGFLELAEDVIKELRTQHIAPSRKLLSIIKDCELPEIARPSLDKIFEQLQVEYGVSEIEYQIARRLRTKRHPNVSTHEAILRLSKSYEGKPQIVTTNFDLLFEYADKKLSHFIPPDLPNLAYGQGLNGLVYLHGRMNGRIRRGDPLQHLVVSSSDFGQAYLAEGWATQFMLELLDRYTVVLLGYSASDPPVRYLLQGLRKSRLMRGARIFAFDSGPEEEVRARWNDSIVNALAYTETPGHSALWNTMKAWAQRADDPWAWQQEVVGLAQRGPRKLKRHERGQVASVVKTFDGARLFARADPAPPGEWLCVFDSSVRYGEVERDLNGELPDFDPLAEYGLDDDPPRPAGGDSDQRPRDDHLLSLRSTDSYEAHLDLAEMPPQRRMQMPARLEQLVSWIVNVSHEPVVPWWAAKHKRIHPLLLRRIDSRLGQGRGDFPPLARSIWGLLFEKFRNVPDNDLPGSLFHIQKLIAAEGWTYRVLLALERGVAPYLATEPRLYRTLGRPPQNDWSELNISDIAEFRIDFPFVREIEFEIPEAVLPSIYRIGRQQLQTVVGMLEVAGPLAREEMKFVLANDMGVVQGDNPNTLLRWFKSLLSRMVEARPELVRADMVFWPIAEGLFFHGLRLFAWSFERLFAGDEVGEEILTLSDKMFWNGSHIPKLKQVLGDRWQEFTTEQRRGIEERIANGRERFAIEREDDYERGKLLQSGRILVWLASRGCILGRAGEATVASFREIDPDWRPESEQDEDDDGRAQGGWITKDSDPSVLLDASLSQIIPLAEEYTTSSFEELKDYEPFAGLIEQRPDRAIAALILKAKEGDYPLKFWKTALQEWPDGVPSSTVWLFGNVMAWLPSHVVVDLRFELFRWLKEHLLKVASEDQPRALSILDASLGKLFEGGGCATESGIDEVGVAGNSYGRSRKILFHAINSPVGIAAMILLDLLRPLEIEGGSGLPSSFKLRLERLLDAPGEGADHAVCIIAQSLEWLHYLDPEWARVTIVPWFDWRHPYSESAWNGLLFRNNPPGPQLFSKLRHHFLNIFRTTGTRNWDDERLRSLHRFLVIACLWRKYDKAYLTFSEVRLALQQTNERGRIHTIQCLADFIERTSIDVNWQQFGKRFIEEAWPKETQFQSGDISLNLARLAGVTGDDFPDVVQAIFPLLVPICGDSWFLLRIVSRAGDADEFELATKFPQATLSLMNKLIPEHPPERLFDLNNILDRLSESSPTLRQDSSWRRLKRIALQG